MLFKNNSFYIPPSMASFSTPSFTSAISTLPLCLFLSDLHNMKVTCYYCYNVQLLYKVHFLFWIVFRSFFSSSNASVTSIIGHYNNNNIIASYIILSCAGGGGTGTSAGINNYIIINIILLYHQQLVAHQPVVAVVHLLLELTVTHELIYLLQFCKATSELTTFQWQASIYTQGTIVQYKNV